MYGRRLKLAVFHRLRKPLSMLLTLALILPCLITSASANDAVYEETYNIHNVMEYIEQYAKSFNSKYEIAYAVIDEKWAMEEDCTNFTSQCLIAGGIPTTTGWTSNSKHSQLGSKSYPDYYDSNKSHTIYRGYTDGYNAFVNAGLFNKYLAAQGYLVEKSVSTNGNALTINNLRPAVGDIVQFDWDGNGIIDHSMICCGFTAKGEPCFAGHSSFAYMLPFSQIQSARPFTYIPAANYVSGTVIYLIHMTDTIGLTDVTSRYQDGQIVAIRSQMVKQYVSADTNQRGNTVNAVANRKAADTWEFFEIKKNGYGEVGFRSLSNGNFLSARVDLDPKFAPIQAAYGWNYKEPQAWESFRIFEKDGIQYIQSQANGKWVQVVADQDGHPLKAAAREARAWEQFSLEIVSTPVTTNTAAPSNSTPSNTTTTQPSAPATQPNTNRVDQLYYGSGYNEGIYSGEFSNGKPNGFGKLEYTDRNGDGLFYTLTFGTQCYRAKSYEGYFKDGFRSGEGTVEYEGGYSATGNYYGAWQAGKTVFEGTLYYPDGTSWDCRMVCDSNLTANLYSR